MTDNKKTSTTLQIEVVDVAGALTSVSAAFSNTAINIDRIAGSGRDAQNGQPAMITITFNAEEAEKKVLLRKIERLTKVTTVKEL